MKHRIFSNWNFIRTLRLILGVFILIQSFVEKNWALAIVGFLFTAMPVFNIGCCGINGCNITPTKSSKNLKEIEYEELV